MSFCQLYKPQPHYFNIFQKKTLNQEDFFNKEEEEKNQAKGRHSISSPANSPTMLSKLVCPDRTMNVAQCLAKFISHKEEHTL